MTATGSDSDGWIATWITATIPEVPELRQAFGQRVAEFTNQTLRQIIFTSVGGSAIRVRLSNRNGIQPLQIGKAAFALRHKPMVDNVELIADSVVPITFSGSPSIEILPGEEIVSDVLNVNVLPHQTITIDLYLPVSTGPVSETGQAGLTYMADGDRAGDIGTAGFSKPEGHSDIGGGSWYYLRGIDVFNPKVKDVIVVGADSVSFSKLTALDGNVKWPQFLSRRLRKEFGDDAPSVVQSTLSGNRLLVKGTHGPSILERFERDFLSVPGITKIIMMVGVNDFNLSGMPESFGLAAQGPVPTAEAMASGYTKLAEMAHARNLKIFCCTVTPGEGMRFAGLPIWTDAKETERRKVNEWILTFGPQIFDGVFDFSGALENTRDRSYFDPSNSSDGVHPNVGGHYNMAYEVDLKTLMGGG